MDTTMEVGHSSVNGRALITYRLAEPEEATTLLTFLHTKFYPEHEFGGVKFSADLTKSLDYIHDILDRGLVIIAAEGRKIVGSIGLYPHSPWWTSEQALVDSWLFVDPDYRRSSIGKSLLRAAKEYAEILKMPLIVGIYNSKDTERKDQFYRRAGFENVGGWYVAKGG